jgi:RNA polymerase sigma-70 factor (ECF subfamily)
MQWFQDEELDWDAVYAEQLPRIYNYFRFRLGGETEAEELTAATFEKAWRARHRYRRDVAAFSTWLLRIARNLAVDHLRSRRTLLPIDDALELVGEEDHAALLELTSDLARLAKHTVALSERDRELIALKYGASLTNRQIARFCGLSESNVGTILHRLVQGLRARW